MSSLPELLFAGLSTALLTHFLTPLVHRLGKAWGLVDHPSWRRSQTEAVPCSGGLAIYAATVAAGLALIAWVGLPMRMGSILALGLGGLAIIVLGVVDDRFGLHAEKKLLGQILVVSLPMSSGLILQQITLPGLGVVDLGIAAGPVTLFWYLGFINSLNLIDGLDGLAAGIGAVVLGALVLTVRPLDPVGAMWLMIFFGAVLGFLRNNLSGRRIFLGDAGSMLLGLWLAGLSLGLSSRTPSAVSIAVIAMAVPIVDTSTTILRRWRRRVSVFQADAEHLHHRLLRLGSTPRRAVACLWFVSLGSASLGALLHGHESAGILALGSLAAAAIEFAYTLPRDGRPGAREALFYLLGMQAELGTVGGAEPEPASRLAEVIEIQPYRELRRGPVASPARASSPPPPSPGVADASTGRAQPEEAKTSANAQAKVGAAGEASDDVLLAITDDPR